MTPQEIIELAQERAFENTERRKDPSYKKTMAWFCYLGLMRNNKVAPQRFRITLEEALKAADCEPRIFELLPAIIVNLPKAIVTNEQQRLPEDLDRAVRALKGECKPNIYKQIPFETYAQWLNAPCFDIAKRRLNFRKAPRSFRPETSRLKNSLAEIVREGRCSMSMTQVKFAEKYEVSLTALRDLEKGKMTMAIATVDKILQALGRQIRY